MVTTAADVLKINFDGAYMKETSRGAWGFVIRDHEGHGVAAGYGAIANVQNAISSEAEAYLAGLRLACHLGISKIILETDCSNLKQALESLSHDIAPGGLFKEARDVLFLDFDVFSTQYCNPICNAPANELARSSLSMDPGQLPSDSLRTS